MSTEEDLGFGSWAFVSMLALVALFFGFVFASQVNGWIGAVGICGLIFLSAGTVGALLGFIFSVPRVISDSRGQADVRGAGARVLDTNTNLERISDWLSTMLVGVGLSQLTNLNPLLLQFRIFLAENATVYIDQGQPSAGVIPAVGPFVLILGAASGFLFMYLMTRLVLVGFFKESEDILSGVAVAAIRVAVAQAKVGADDTGTTGGERVIDANKDGLAHAVENGSTVGQDLSSATAATFQHLSTAKTLRNDDALEVMFELLYEPGGYQRVIQMSGELSRTAITKRADYWFYLAAAFGQQMHHTAEGSEDRMSARDNAIDAARRAVHTDKSFRARLWAISNPNSTDNDLALLRDDSDFRQLAGP